jgi:hypothetical protein
MNRQSFNALRSQCKDDPAKFERLCILERQSRELRDAKDPAYRKLLANLMSRTADELAALESNQ